MDFGLFIGIVGLILGIIFFLVSQAQSHRLQERLSEITQDKQRLEQLSQQLQRKLPEIRSHTVLMDGISGSGKSTFIARIMSPVSGRDQLEDMAATTSAYQTVEVPICWESDAQIEHSIIHHLNFFDVSGENPATFINALSDLHSKHVTNVVLVIVWDISKEFIDQNIVELSRARLQATYGNEMAKKMISSIIVFFNKIDQRERDELPKILGEQKNIVNTLFQSVFEVGYGKIHYIDGSALRGTHVHDCVGLILRQFGLAPNFARITGNASKKR
jgi:CHASE3 domain sensor protein